MSLTRRDFMPPAGLAATAILGAFATSDASSNNAVDRSDEAASSDLISKTEQEIADVAGRLGAAKSVGQRLPHESLPWITFAELTADPLRTIDRVAAVYDTRRVVGGTFLLARVARALAEALLRTWLHGGPIPDLALAAPAFQLGDDGRINAIDSGAESDIAEPDPELVATTFVDGIRPIVEAFRVDLSIGRRGLWGLVADAVAGAAATIADSDIEVAVTLRDVVDAVSATSAAKPAFIVTDRGVDFVRGSCCLAFHLDDHGYCETCPVGRRAATSSGPTWVHG